MRYIIRRIIKIAGGRFRHTNKTRSSSKLATFSMYSNVYYDDDRERYFRCKICSCYYKRECDIEQHVVNNHNMTVLNSIQRAVLYTGKCKLCGSELAQSSYNKHVRDLHEEIFFSADRTVAVKAKRKQKQDNKYNENYSHSQYIAASTSRNDMMSYGYFEECRTYQKKPVVQRGRSARAARSSRGRGKPNVTYKNVQINFK